MFDVNELHRILKATTAQFRKGDGVVEDKARGSVSVYMMPHESTIRDGDDVEKVDLHFVTVAVDKVAAEANRASLISILDNYPEPDRLARGPSYIEVGGAIGDQGAAFQLFALGKVLDLWAVITPEGLGLTGVEADNAAGSGYIMITGYRSQQGEVE